MAELVRCFKVYHLGIYESMCVWLHVHIHVEFTPKNPPSSGKKEKRKKEEKNLSVYLRFMSMLRAEAGRNRDLDCMSGCVSAPAYLYL